MLAVGLTDDGSSSVPTLTTVNCGREDELANMCEPHFGQNRRRTWLPLSAVTVNSLSSPEQATAMVGTITFTVPFAAVR